MSIIFIDKLHSVQCLGCYITGPFCSCKNVQYAIFVHQASFAGNYFGFFCNCSQCLFCDTFHSKCNFCIQIFKLTEGLITKNKLQTVVCSRAKNALISVPLPNCLLMTIYILARKIILQNAEEAQPVTNTYLHK